MHWIYNWPETRFVCACAPPLPKTHGKQSSIWNLRSFIVGPISVRLALVGTVLSVGWFLLFISLQCSVRIWIVCRIVWATEAYKCLAYGIQNWFSVKSHCAKRGLYKNPFELYARRDRMAQNAEWTTLNHGRFLKTLPSLCRFLNPLAPPFHSHLPLFFLLARWREGKTRTKSLANTQTSATKPNVNINRPCWSDCFLPFSISDRKIREREAVTKKMCYFFAILISKRVEYIFLVISLSLLFSGMANFE